MDDDDDEVGLYGRCRHGAYLMAQEHLYKILGDICMLTGLWGGGGYITFAVFFALGFSLCCC